MAALIAW